MPLRPEHQIVSVDDHLIEHPRVWQDRLPASFWSGGPRIIEQNGAHVWTYVGQIFANMGLNAVAGKPVQEWGMDPVRCEEMIPGCYDPQLRVQNGKFTTRSGEHCADVGCRIGEKCTDIPT